MEGEQGDLGNNEFQYRQNVEYGGYVWMVINPYVLQDDGRFFVYIGRGAYLQIRETVDPCELKPYNPRPDQDY